MAPRPRVPETAKSGPQVEILEDRCLLSSATYVVSLYTGLLHRIPALPEVALWVGALDAGESARYVALSFTASPEYLGDVVTAGYQLLLHRAPDLPGLLTWAADLQAGLTPEQLAASLVASDEYFALHGSNPGSWLEGIYHDLLGRPLDPSGAGTWGQALQAGASGLDVVLGIALSPEALTRIVDAAYVQWLGRAPDDAGQAFWVNQLQLGSSSTAILVGIASSDEAVALQGGLDPFTPSPNDALATTPLPISGQGNPDWDQGEAQNEAAAAQGPAPLLFLGDSITYGLASGAGEPVWDSLLAPLGAVDFGIGGLTTSQVLWQAQSGQVAALAPNVIVLLIGSNNLGGGQSPAAVAEGIGRIVDTLKVVAPQAKILLLGILPRSFSPDDPLRSAIAQTNALIALLADGQRVAYRDIGSSFLQPDGSISPDVMADGVHPTLYGYQILTAAIWPTLLQLMPGQ